MLYSDEQSSAHNMGVQILSWVNAEVRPLNAFDRLMPHLAIQDEFEFTNTPNNRMELCVARFVRIVMGNDHVCLSITEWIQKWKLRG